MCSGSVALRNRNLERIEAGDVWTEVRAAYLRARGVAEGRARRSEDGDGGSDGETDALSCDLIASPLAGSARALGRISAVVTRPVPAEE